MIAELAIASLVLGAVGFSLSIVIVIVGIITGEDEKESDLVRAIDRLLPQTQCAQCGYPGCMPYAQAIAQGEEIDLCPPGGEKTQRGLAELLDRPLGSVRHLDNTSLIASIREKDCIGCGLCVPACPVDAIVGAEGFLHVVLKEHCTGCELCLAPCPVDCIELVDHQ